MTPNAEGRGPDPDRDPTYRIDNPADDPMLPRGADLAAAEAVAFGAAAERIVRGRWRPRDERLALGLTLAALLPDAIDPALARRFAWPALRDLIGDAA